MHYPGLGRMTVPYFIRTGSMLISTSGIPRPLTLQEDYIIVPVKKRVMSHGSQLMETPGSLKKIVVGDASDASKRVLVQVREDQWMNTLGLYTAAPCRWWVARVACEGGAA